jgi:hypothetical protein
VAAQEQDRERQDRNQPWEDEADPADESTQPATEVPGAQNRELSRRRAGQQIRDGDPSSKSVAEIQPRSVTQSLRSRRT